MTNLKGKLTPLVVISLVLVLGLLTAASAGLFQGAQDVDGSAAAEQRAGAEQQAEMNAAASGQSGPNEEGSVMQDDRMPTTLPMPDTNSRAGATLESSNRRGVTRAQLATLLVDKFDFTADSLLPRGIDRQSPPHGEVAGASADGNGGTAAETVALRDVAGHPAEAAITAVTDARIMDGHFDGTFRPDALITRADVALALVRVLGINELASDHAPVESKFRDVPAGHKAFAAIAMLDRLGMYPFHVGTLFAPDERIELAEVTHTVETARRLELAHGPIVHVNAPARTISVEREARHAISYIEGAQTLVIRNGVPVTIEQLQPGDDVRLFADDTGELLVVVANGPAPEPTAMSEAVVLMRELATPEQLAAIIARDWDKAAIELKASVYNQLLERGATAEEASALLAQDWPVVEERGKLRLTEVIVDSTAVNNEELVRAVLDQDWDAALSQLEVEVLEYLLNYLMV